VWRACTRVCGAALAGAAPSIPRPVDSRDHGCVCVYALGLHALSEYLDTVSLIILQSGGVVDKYIGDIAMAFWNAPLPVMHHQKVACGVALDSQKKLQFLAKGTLHHHDPSQLQ
jgi:hypothetical protein